MDKREKALKGLECCACPDGACGICPYFKDRSEPCVTIMAADVLKMLKEQETELCDRCGRRRLESNRVEKEGETG